MPGNQGGESETIIGKWLKARGGRDKVVIATKVGMEMPGIGQGLCAAPTSWRGSRTRSSACRPTTSTSTSRTATTRRRRWRRRSAPISELIEQGKVRAIGASNYEAPRLAAGPEDQRQPTSCRATRACSRSTTSPTAPASRSELEPLCLKENVGVIPYYALAAGFLTGKYRSEADFSKSPRGGRMEKLPQRPRSPHPQGAGRGGGAPRRQARLRWRWPGCIARPSVTAPIASATSMAQLEELTTGIRLQLDKAAIDELDGASA